MPICAAVARCRLRSLTPIARAARPTWIGSARCARTQLSYAVSTGSLRVSTAGMTNADCSERGLATR
jgi:hypothetical protein